MTFRLHKPLKNIPNLATSTSTLCSHSYSIQAIIMYKYFVVLRGYTGDNHAIFLWFLYFNMQITLRLKPEMHFTKVVLSRTTKIKLCQLLAGPQSK